MFFMFLLYSALVVKRAYFLIKDTITLLQVFMYFNLGSNARCETRVGFNQKKDIRFLFLIDFKICLDQMLPPTFVVKRALVFNQKKQNTHIS